MNKLILAIFAFVIIVSSSSCKKETTIVAPDTTTINLIGSNWVTTDNGLTFTTTISVPEITNYYQSQGAVLLYNYLGQNEYEQLPNVYAGTTYRFTYNIGNIYIDAQSATANSSINTPPNLNLKLVLVQ